MLSLGLQAAVLAVLVLVPILHPEVVPFAVPKMTLEAPRFTPPTPPVTAPPVRVRLAMAPTAPSAAIPRSAQLPSFTSDARPVDAPVLAVGVNLGEKGQNPLAALTSIGPARTPVVGVAGAPAVKGPASPVRISTGILAGLLLSPIRPDYPPIAKMSRTEGTVVVEAVISTTGRIENAHIISGPAVLQGSALQAVRAARYRPFLLNGAPTEVETTISINFRLGSE